MLHVSSLQRRRKQEQRRADGAGWTSSRLFAFWSGKRSRSQELLPTRERRRGWAEGQGSPGAEPAAASPAAGRQPRGGHFGRGAGRPFAEVETEAAGLAAAWWTQTSTVAQRTAAAPNVWHGRAGASEGGQHPTTNPARGAGGVVPQQDMGKQQNNNNDTTNNKKKLCKRPSTLSCSARTPKRTRYVTV